MTITSKKYLLAIAMTILSSVATMMPNGSTVLEDLIEIYKGTELYLEEKLHDTAQNTVQYLEKKLQAFEYDDHARYPLVICKKYRAMLKQPIQESMLEELEATFHYYRADADEALETWYARDILTAVYFDKHKVNKDYIELAYEWGNKDISNNRYQSWCIQAYLYAKMAGIQAEENPEYVHRWAVNLQTAMELMNPDEKKNYVLTRLIKNEFTKLSEYYLINRKEIDKIGSEAHQILEQYGYI